MDFIPQQPKKAADVPYYEDTRAEGGWQGQGTGKQLKTLRAEVAEVITRLGGNLVGIQEGQFVDGKRKRDGCRIAYLQEGEGGEMQKGLIDVAALPVRRESNREKSIKMMLFMLRDALNGLWFLQQLSPGYAALMPFMLVDGERNVTQVWSQAGKVSLLLPSPVDEFVDGEWKHV